MLGGWGGGHSPPPPPGKILSSRCFLLHSVAPFKVIWESEWSVFRPHIHTIIRLGSMIDSKLMKVVGAPSSKSPNNTAHSQLLSWSCQPVLHILWDKYRWFTITIGCSDWWCKFFFFYIFTPTQSDLQWHIGFFILYTCHRGGGSQNHQGIAIKVMWAWPSPNITFKEPWQSDTHHHCHGQLLSWPWHFPYRVQIRYSATTPEETHRRRRGSL